MEYTTQERIKGFLGRVLTESELVNLVSQIEAISNAISAYLGRSYQDVDSDIQDYVEEVEESEKYYDGSHEHILFIDDALSVSEVIILDSQGGEIETIDQESYILHPLNSLPKNSIYLRNRRFPGYLMAVKIKAQFSSGLVPVEIVMAVTALTGFESESIEGYSYKIASGNTTDQNIATQLAAISHLRKIIF
jgi:hypothetical protein